jgi:uncharacterized phosphosugar-binding protein
MISKAEWMVSNGDRLVKAIENDGHFDGPESSVILQEMISNSAGDLATARSIFMDKMKEKNLEQLVPFNAFLNNDFASI